MSHCNYFIATLFLKFPCILLFLSFIYHINLLVSFLFIPVVFRALFSVAIDLTGGYIFTTLEPKDYVPFSVYVLETLSWFF
jgi:hypothetical protein